MNMIKGEVKIVPIGIIHTPFSINDRLPRQGSFSEETEGHVQLNMKFVDGLLDLNTFTHAILVFHFHESDFSELIQKPKRDNKPHGVFATRTPQRPSGIGTTTVRIKSVKENIIEFYGADMIDGTPLLDIKPYIPDIDSYPDAGRGWLDSVDK